MTTTGSHNAGLTNGDGRKRGWYGLRSLRVCFFKIGLLTLFVTIIVFPVIPLWAEQSTKSAPSLDGLKGQIHEHQKKVKRVEDGIRNQSQRVEQSLEKKKSLLAELDQIDHQLAEQQDKLTKLKKGLAAQEDIIRPKNQALTKLQADKKSLQERVKKRLAAFYRVGSVGMLNILLTSQTLPDMLAQQERLARLVKYDHSLLERYKAKINELSLAKERLEKEKEKLAGLIAERTHQEELLAKSRQDKAALLERVNTEKELYQRALDELEAASQKLNATIKNLQNKARALEREAQKPTTKSTKKKGATGEFTALKGKLEPPVSGTVVSLFGRSHQGKFGINTFQNGIDIKTKTGAQIKAIYDGVVIYSGQLKGYGNLLIVDHGDQYYSLVSRVGEFYKKEGDRVAKGDVVGLAGDEVSLLGEGLHFEIRHGSKPEDPLLWVNSANLKIEAGKRKPD